MGLSLAIACDDSKTGNTNPATFAETLDRVAEAQCRTLYMCCDAWVASLPNNPEVPQNLDACIVQQKESLALVAVSYAPALNAGTVIFDGAKAAACLATLANGTCSTPWPRELEELCVVAIVGQLNDGEGDCEGADDFCKSGKCGGTLCQPMPKIGESCLNTCAEDAYCPNQGASLCTARRANGAACQRNDHCLTDTCNAGTCGPRLPLECPAPESPG